MIDLNGSLHRRRFLGTVAAGAAAIGLSGLASPFRSVAAPAGTYSPGTEDASFESWLGQIKGKHKQVFDAPGVNDALPLAWTRVFLMTHTDMGTPESDMTAVLILRHAGIPVAMEDRLWQKYNFGEVFKVTDSQTKKPATRNLFHKDDVMPLPDMSVVGLQKHGTMIGVCGMAIKVYSMNVAKQMNMDPEEVRKDWISGVLPGIQVVPSGVYAINRTQEKGCTYCYAG
jgi:intracellular sulfur oxidation DsrE/DsrF family protein